MIANPYYQFAPFNGTSYYSSPTLARSTLAAPYPQFSGITLTKANAAASWYNSFQASYEVRAKNGLTLVANWTFSKQVYQNAYNDIQRLVPERSIYQYDQPQSVKFSAVYDLPFGKGKRFWNTSHRFVSRLVSGCGNQHSPLVPLRDPLEIAQQLHLCQGSQDSEHQLEFARRAGCAALRGTMEYQWNHYTRWTFPFIVIGANSIFIYSVEEVLRSWLNRAVGAFTFRFTWIGDFAPVAQSCAVLLVMWYVCYWLYRRKIFFKL